MPLMNHFVKFFSTCICGNGEFKAASLPTPVAGDQVLLNGRERKTFLFRPKAKEVEDVISLLRSEVKRVGGQSARAINMGLIGLRLLKLSTI
jgi:hypothetical protein